MFTTLAKIRDCHPCASSWKTLLTGLNKTSADNEILPLSSILKINGVEDTLWAFQCVNDNFKREQNMFKIWCAKQVRHAMKDVRSIHVLIVAENFEYGEATAEEMKLATADAYNAAAVYNGTNAAVYNVATAVAYIVDYAAVFADSPEVPRTKLASLFALTESGQYVQKAFWA